MRPATGNKVKHTCTELRVDRVFCSRATLLPKRACMQQEIANFADDPDFGGVSMGLGKYCGSRFHPLIKSNQSSSVLHVTPSGLLSFELNPPYFVF